MNSKTKDTMNMNTIDTQKIADFVNRRSICLARLRNLRKTNAPLWIIRSEQVSLALLRKNLKFAGIGKPASKTQTALMAKYVTPLMIGE